MKNDFSLPVVTAVAEPYPDGQRISKAVVEFSGDVPNVNEICVKDRTIVGRTVEGNVVTLELSADDEKARVIPGFASPPNGARGIVPKTRKPIEVEVVIPGYSAAIKSTKAVQPVIDDFEQGAYKRILYNLFKPKNYDPAKKYPLVMFMPDASPNGNDAMLALVQGIGATCWATPEEQEKHPCFVLAVQIPEGIRLTTNEYTVSDEFEDVKELLDKTIAEYSIDPCRIYTTGQSQGCMASFELNVRFPDLFAASMFVSGHWDVEKVSALNDSKFLFGLSEGGLREYPCFNRITDAFIQQGVDVGIVRLNFREGWEINEKKVKQAISGKQMAYIIFDKETIFPDDGKQRPDMMHHARGWELTYQLEAARDWLFAQHK